MGTGSREENVSNPKSEVHVWAELQLLQRV